MWPDLIVAVRILLSKTLKRNALIDVRPDRISLREPCAAQPLLCAQLRLPAAAAFFSVLDACSLSSRLVNGEPWHNVC